MPRVAALRLARRRAVETKTLPVEPHGERPSPIGEGEFGGVPRSLSALGGLGQMGGGEPGGGHAEVRVIADRIGTVRLRSGAAGLAIDPDPAHRATQGLLGDRGRL